MDTAVEKKPAAPATPLTIEQIPLAAIVPSPFNPRKHFDKAALDELAESIKVHGVQQPILVRRSLNNANLAKYELVVGERRWRASKIAAVQTIPALVRELTDVQAMEINLTEQMQREDLDPLEEADGYQQLMRLKKINADQLAELLGKSRSYVYSRTKLNDLCPEGRKALVEGTLDASRALLISRIGHHDTQRQALKDITQGEYRGDTPMTYREAHQHILHNYMLKLKSAPFDVKDANLTKAGACEPCPKRSGNQRDLFGDVKDADICTDPKCFDDKRQAHFARDRKKLLDAGKKVIHGDAAKKALPRWEDGHTHGGNRLAGPYVALGDTTYAGGRSRPVAEILGDDYDPILIEHPRTGAIIKAATQQAVATAAARGRGGPAGAALPRPKPKSSAPDVDEMLLVRLVKLLHGKAPAKFSRAQMFFIVQLLFRELHPRSDHLRAIALAFGWPASAFGSGYSDKARLPKVSEKLDEQKLLLLALELIFVNHGYYYPAEILRQFGISADKERDWIINARRTAAALARAAAKAKEKPKAKTAAKPARLMEGFVPKARIAVIVGVGPITRVDVTKKLWLYIKTNRLQDKKNKRMINADARLKSALGVTKAQVSMFDMMKLVNKQLAPAKAK